MTEYAELSVAQVNYTIEKSGGDEYPVIHVFGRSQSRELIHVRVLDLPPYFYAPKDSVSMDDLNHAKIVDWEEGHQSIRGKELIRLECPTPRDVGNVRKEFEHYEGDVLFPNRFLVDKGIKSGMRVPDKRNSDGVIEVHHSEVEPLDMSANLRVNTFDIEVDDRQGFPEDGEEEIICITAHDSYRDEYIAWLYTGIHNPSDAPDELPNYEPMSEGTDIEVLSFRDEDEMLDSFLTYIEETDPDILTGWNFDDFDAPYLLDRLERLDGQSDYDLDYGRLSRIDEVWRSNYGAPNIKGRIVFDLLYAYKKRQWSEKDSYRLDAIGEDELGVGKEVFLGDIGQLWEDDPEKLLEYNFRDVEICVELNDKEELIQFWSEAASFVGCKLEDAPTAGDACDMYVLHRAHGEFVLPSKKHAQGEEFEGAAVFEPITGLREMVSVLDLKSLYPMSMVTINASPETKVGPDYEGETFVAPNGAEFRKKPEGMVKDMIFDLLDERDKKKEMRDKHSPGSDKYNLYDIQQGAVKIIMNALYGVLGWDKFRLYDREMGAAVTSVGREVIRFTKDVAEELDYPAVYGDTDSVMLELGGDVSESQAINLSFMLEDEINTRYNDFAKEVLGADEHYFQMEFEKLYRTFFQAGKKKRYAGHIIWKEGKRVDSIDITGFEYKRSDIAPVTKDVQEELIQLIVYGEGKDAVIDYLEEVIREFQKGELPPEEVGMPGGIGKELDDYKTETAHVRGSKRANVLFGTNYGKGDKPKRVYLDRVLPEYFERVENEHTFTGEDNQVYENFKRDPDVICFEFNDQIPDEFQIDWEEMLEKVLEGPISRVIEGIGLSWSEVKDGEKQMGLADF